jgi:hypothetical protein
MATPLILALLLAIAPLATSPNDGRHDFDFEIGTWTMSPGAYGHVARELWIGATIGELIVPKPTRHVRGSLLKLYDPARRIWNIYWADAGDGSLSPPLTGAFRDRVGTFVGNDTGGGHRKLVRLVYDRITQRSFRTLQSESVDGGHTWSRPTVEIYTRSTAAD